MIDSLFLRELLIQARLHVEDLTVRSLRCDDKEKSVAHDRQRATSELLHLEVRTGMSSEEFLIHLNKWAQDLEKQSSGSILTFHVSSVPLMFRAE